MCLTCSFHGIWDSSHITILGAHSLGQLVVILSPIPPFWSQWCSSILSVKWDTGTKWLWWGDTEIPWERNNDWRSSGVMLWSWISSLPSYNSSFSQESVNPSVSAAPLLFWAWDPAAQSLRCLSFGLFSFFLWKHHGSIPIVLWVLCLGPGAGRAVREAVNGAGLKKTCSITLLQWPGDAVLTGMHSLRISLSPLKQS